MINIDEQYCVLDIETNTIEELPNPLLDELRYVGFKYNGRYGIFHYTERDKIQDSINHFQYFVGHNIKDYDKIVLERHGFKFRKDQIFIDTYIISDNRLKSMMYIDLNQGDRSLRRLCERFNLESKKGEFDYSLLKKDTLINEEYDLLKEYLIGDLNSADALFKFYYETFYGFKEFMSDEDKRRMCWLINKPGSTAYKCICNLTGLPEEYEDIKSDEDNLYSGGYVSEPYTDFIEG